MSSILFHRELDLITTPDIKTFATIALNLVPDYFWTIPASTSGKYHPSYALGEGGLVRHVKATVQLAEYMFNLDQVIKEFDTYDRDIIYASLLLHDCWKCGREEDITEEGWRTTFEHPLIAVCEITRIAEDIGGKYNSWIEKISDDICSCIYSHMGQWTTDKRHPGKELPIPFHPREKMVHLCDYLASRKKIEIVFEEEKTE